MRFNIKIILPFLFFAILLASCKDPVQPIDPAENLPTQELQTILALGDSYTIGQSVAVPERWPNQLVQQLRDKKYEVADPVIIARTGWTTSNLIQAINSTQLTPPYHLVTLLIGVNDQFQGRNLENYQQGFTNLLNKAIELAGNNPARVIVVSIPDYSVTPYGQNFNPGKIRTELDQFNALNRQLSQTAGVHYVDITPISRLAANDLSLLASDQLHPSGKMYAEWVKLILPMAEEILQRSEKKLNHRC